MAKLASRHCSPVKKGSKPLSSSVARSLLNQINNTWRFDAQVKSIECEFKFADYHRTIQFVNAVAWIANTQNHHPDLEIGYDRCKVTFSTHTAGGLTVNDFICAAKVDALLKETENVSAPTSKTPAAKKTTAIPPAVIKKPAKVATRGGDLSFNFQEAEELLNENINLSSEPDNNSNDYKDEFDLIEPDIKPVAYQASRTVKIETMLSESKSRTTSSEKTDTDKIHTSAAPGPSVKSQHAIDLMSTVILPPGMQTIGGNPPYDDDEDSTVIIPEDLQPDNEFESARSDSTFPEPNQSVQTDETAKQDNDEIKTMVFDVANQKPLDPDATMILSVPLSSIAESPAQHQAHTTDKPPAAGNRQDPDEIGTMILSSNPMNRPKSGSSPVHSATADPEEIATLQNRENAGVDLNPQESDNHMATMIMSSADVAAITDRVSEKSHVPAEDKKSGETDPEIEDDDTLVMHVNSYQKVRHDKE